MMIVICPWQVGSVNKQAANWSLLYQRVQTLQMGLIGNKNLNNYTNSSVYSAIDNQTFINDRTKAKRSYNTEQCIKDLRAIQKAIDDEKVNWAKESKQIQLLKILVFIFEMLD